MEIFITLLIVVCMCILFYWLCSKLPSPLNLIGQIIVIAAGAIWLITHIRDLVHAIAG